MKNKEKKRQKKIFDIKMSNKDQLLSKRKKKSNDKKNSTNMSKNNLSILKGMKISQKRKSQISKTKLKNEKHSEKTLTKNNSTKIKKKIKKETEIQKEENDLYIKTQIEELKNYYKNQNYENALKLSDIILFKNQNLDMIYYIKANSLLFMDSYKEAINVI